MKYFISLIIWLFLIIWNIWNVSAAVNISNVTKDASDIQEITDKSINVNTNNADPISVIERSAESILITIKTVVWGLLVIYMVYAGIQMVISMWTDEEQLSSAKRQLWYVVVAFVFINIPGAIFDTFNSQSTTTIDARPGYSWWFNTPSTGDSWNIFVNMFSLWNTLSGDIIGFIQILISVIAVSVILLAAIKMLTSRAQEDQVSESKNKIIWSVISLLLVGFIESWKYVIYKGEVDDGSNFFETIVNLWTFFAWPIAIAFLTYAGYLFITANGEEDRVNKAKSIVINVLLATVILLATYTFLLDLITL